jgi:hypothetical protein
VSTVDDNWLQTYTGRAFPILTPTVEDVDPRDIAHALSMICRYGGHASRFYSVAEHCLLISEAVSPENAAWGLLHDAGEAYLGDVITPLKRLLPDYKVIEHRLQDVICDRFKLNRECPAEVHEADRRILHDERPMLLSRSLHPWVGDGNGALPLGVDIVGWRPMMVESLYRRRLTELGLS